MKIAKFIAVSVIALACSAFTAKAGNALTSNNGLAAGQALAYLYSAYKTDSKIDLTKPANISNIISLITNIKGLKAQKNNTTTNASTAFINALIGNSANLVTPQNSPSVLGALAGISSLDTSSLTNLAATAATQAATQAATTAATNAATKALGGLFSKAKSTAAAAQPAATTAAAATSEAMTAVNALTNIFNLVK